MPSPDPQAGTLTLVATPIGNLADMSFRAVEALKKADCIACEDTRHSRRLCAHYGISARLISYYREKERERGAQLVQLLRAGRNIALITDAGTPGLSDPGAVLVRLARAAGITVTAVPGASALMTALALAGLESHDFYFGGFLPATSAARQQCLRRLAPLPCPLVFYEAPHRIHACLQVLCTVFGGRQAQLFRELTKLHEERLAGALPELRDRVAAGLKGELVLVIAGHAGQLTAGAEELAAMLRWHRDECGASLKEAVNATAQALALPRTPVYRAALALWQETTSS